MTAQKPGAKRGRPNGYSPKITGEICRRLVEGESLRAICRDKKMPAASTVLLWVGKHEEFRDWYARAREWQTGTIADEIIDIADDARNDFMERTRRDGTTEIVFDSENVQRSPLQIDTRKWLLAKMAPKKWGNRLELSGKDGASVVPIINVTAGGAELPVNPG